MIKLGQAIVQSKAEFLALKLPELCARLAIEDEMPGKLFALQEEVLISLTLFTNIAQESQASDF